MKLKLLSLFCLLSLINVYSQCTYTLLMTDSYGDGWNGFSVNVIVNGNEVLSGQTLSFGNSDFIGFPVNQGDEIVVEVNTTGIYDNEVSYSIYDYDLNEVATGNANDEISNGELFAICPAQLQDAINITSLPFFETDAPTSNSPIAVGWNDQDCSLMNLSHRAYRYEPTTDVNLAVAIENGDSDSFIQVYVADEADPFNYNALEFYSNDTCGNSTSKTINMISGDIYYILIGNPNTDSTIIFYDNDSDIINIPDPNLKQALLNTNCNSPHTFNFENTFLFSSNPFYSISVSNNSADLDINNDGELQQAEALLAERLNLIGFDITSLEGLQFFTNLKALYIGDNNISDITQIQSLDLEILSCPANQLTSLDLSQATNLKALNCSDNQQLASIDVTQCTDLLYFINHHFNTDFNTSLQALDLTNNTELINLTVNGTTLSTLDLSNSVALKRAFLRFNELNNVNVTNAPNLDYLDCRNNNLSELDVTQNLELITLACSFNQLTTLDLTSNSNIAVVETHFNNITSIDLSQNSELGFLGIVNNGLAALDLSQNPSLSTLGCGGNNFTSLDLSQNTNISTFSCSNGLLTSIDLSNNNLLFNVSLRDNNFLEFINLQNGNNQNISSFSTSGSTNLQTVCVDDITYAITNFVDVEPQTIFVEDCNATSINYNLISGVVTYDDESNGCDPSDVVIPNVMVTTTDGVNEFATFTLDDGSYLIDVVDNMYSTSVILPVYFTTTPDPATSDFNGFGETDTQNFCVIGNQAFEDVEVSFIPLEDARPGFDTDYQLVYENRGVNTIANGTIQLQFNDMVQQFVSATPSENETTANTITFNYTNLLPFESRVIDVTLNTFVPPVVESGDILNFTATIEPIAADNEASNNIFNFAQEVVNSYDPNDITVLQGESILIEEADKDLDYVIRFQNTGTASAINVTITHRLDSDFDLSSFRPISSSHDYRIQISNGDFVEFIFENINLPDIVSDEENSQGFVVFKVKPKSDAIVGDEFTGFADIYFDFNSPIRTNTAFTEIIEPLSIDEFDTQRLLVYPNPTSGHLHIVNASTITSISIYDVNGRLLRSVKPETHSLNYELDVTDLNDGMYFLSVKSKDVEQTIKFIKQ